MEARIREENHHGFYGSGGPDFMLKERDLTGTGKKSLEWDLNNWKWDGDLFVASPSNTVPTGCKSKQLVPVGSRFVSGGSSNSSSSDSDEINVENVKGKGQLVKRRRVTVLEEEGELNGEAGSLALKLGGNFYPTADTEVVNGEEKNGKKAKLQGTNSSRSGCQVDGCGADLSNAKDYHRRHKVCEMHAKASNALVGNAMQRFCQQCSRFHLLQEFDEEKRSCRRRLAGHNRRRRKTNPDAGVGGSSVDDGQAGSYLLISLLRILSNLHSNHSDQAKDQDLLSHLLRNLANIASIFDGRNLQGLLQASHDLWQMGSSFATSSERAPAMPSNGVSCVTAQDTQPFFSTSNLNNESGIQDSLVKPVDQSTSVCVAISEMPQGIVIGNSMGGKQQAVPSAQFSSILPVKEDVAAKAETSCSIQHMLPQESTEQRVKLNDFDLNNIYNESQDCLDESERSRTQTMLATDSLDCPSWVQQDSHHSSPHTSVNSDSASAQSPSSSSGDVQSRTDRIVFKLFGKDPNDFPPVLRAQILGWLAHSPTDIESYIRPGCIILTIYLHLAESTWEELCCNLSSSLNRLLDISGDAFWQTGWLYARIQNQIAFIYNGQVLLNSRLLLKGQNCCRISSVRPVAVSVSKRANFAVRGINLSSSTTRLLCAFEGMYLTQETSHVLEVGGNTSSAEELQCVTFSCSLPNITGRGFIEVEDHGLSSVFFPFIVAEQDICSEICVLESAIEMTDGDDDSVERTGIMKARKQALEFLHEMGWLLRKSHLRSRLDHIDSSSDFFCLSRFKWLMEFSMDHDWCAVVKKLLDILFEGVVDSGQNSSELVLSEMALLHRAVRRNCRSMVELLLRYVPVRLSNKLGAEHNKCIGECSDSFLFRPDMAGPGGMTPLHVAASRDDADNVLDALADDPGQVGIGAWINARDKTGFAPQDYARMRGYFSYIHLVQRKTNKKMEAGHVIVDMPTSTHSQVDSPNFSKLPGFQIEKRESELKKPYCKLCSQQLIRTNASPSLLYRPVMLSMVAIAAVCVCVALLLKGPPDVLFVFHPFRWESLDYGSQ